MCAAQVHGCDDRRVWLAAHRWRRGDDPRNTGDRGRKNRHVRRGDHRELSTGDIAADGLDRDVSVAKDYTWQRFDLDVGHRGALRFGKILYLLLSEADVFHVTRRDLLHGGLDFGFGQLESCGIVFVEFYGQVAHRRVAPMLDICKYPFNRGADLGVVLVLLGLAL